MKKNKDQLIHDNNCSVINYIEFSTRKIQMFSS